MSALGLPRPRRRAPSLTPMIDVVFLLLVFFMLAARFGTDGAISLGLAGGGEGWEGPPRLLELTRGGLVLNGRGVAPEALGPALAALVETPSDPVLIRAGAGVDVQALADLLDRLADLGLATPVLVE